MNSRTDLALKSAGDEMALLTRPEGDSPIEAEGATRRSLVAALGTQRIQIEVSR